MRKVSIIETDRSDRTPLLPVRKALRGKCYVSWNLVGGDIAIVLGDRLDALRIACDLTEDRVPIAHIHGGEASFGSYDNQIRDAITKLSHVHFVAAPEFKIRLVEGLGEDPRRVHVVGAPGLDNLTDLPPRKPGNYFVCTYHPATLEKQSGIHEPLKALKAFSHHRQIWTGVNNDPGNEEIRSALQGRDVRTLTFRDYHLLCRHAAAVVGNSSSGIIEAPTLEVPTVNVGSRQDGRLKGPSVFDCGNGAEDIRRAIKSALAYEGSYENPYGKPGASAKIADILLDISLDNILVKRWPT